MKLLRQGALLQIDLELLIYIPECLLLDIQYTIAS